MRFELKKATKKNIKYLEKAKLYNIFQYAHNSIFMGIQRKYKSTFFIQKARIQNNGRNRYKIFYEIL